MALFVLTGEIQTGKSRWLEAQLSHLEAAGVQVCGVLAPGVWVEVPVSSEHPQGFEKLAIDWVFYPEHDRVRAAWRQDLDPESGADKYTAPVVGGQRFMWKFAQEPFDRANGLFAKLRAEQESGEGEGAFVPGSTRLVVIDEIGRLELNGRGLTEAVALLETGPTQKNPHVLVVCRDLLLEDFLASPMAKAWGEAVQVIAPDDAGQEALLSIVG